MKNIIFRHKLTTRMSGGQPSSPARGVLGLVRIGNCVMAAAGALLAAIVCGGVDSVDDYWAQVIGSMAVVMLFTAAGNSLNDYYDREVDKIAHPDRPIPRGLVSYKSALQLSVLLFAAAIVITLFISFWSLVIVCTSILVIIGYEARMKAEGLIGNLAISWLTGALFLFGGAAVDGMELAWILALLAFLATLGREIIKDIQDIEGDKGSRTTLPMRIGVRKAGIIASLSLAGAVLLSPLPYVLDLFSVWYLPIVAASDGIFIYCALIHFGRPEKGQKMAKLAMLLALLAFLLGGIV